MDEATGTAPSNFDAHPKPTSRRSEPFLVPGTLWYPRDVCGQGSGKEIEQGYQDAIAGSSNKELPVLKEECSIVPEKPTDLGSSNNEASAAESVQSGDIQANNEAEANDFVFSSASTVSPNQSPLRYSLEAILWVMYHSSVLGFIPMLVLCAVFGSTWLFEINYINVLYHTMASDSLFTLFSYLGIATTFLYIFGRKTVWRLIFRITLPLCFLHIIIYAVRQIYMISFLTFVYYGIFVLHYYVLLKNIKTNSATETTPEMNERAKRYSTLSSDGTPMLFFKGFIPYVIVYFGSTNYFVFFFMDSDITFRIIGRVVIMPFVFNLVDTFQNNLLMGKSGEYLKYRMIAGNTMNNISICILRLMITDSPNIRDTLILAVSTAFFEILFRVTYIPRSMFIMRMILILKENFNCGCFSARKIRSFDDIAPISGHQQSVGWVVDIQEASPTVPPAAEIIHHSFIDNRTDTPHKPFAERLHRFIPQYIYDQDIADYLINQHLNRLFYVSMFEIQSSIFMPIIMYLCSPIKDYVKFQTFSSVEQMCYSLVIQLSAEIFTQVMSVLIDNYLYGITLPIAKSWKYNMKPAVLVHSTLLLIMAASMASYPFRPSTEYWKKDG